MPLKKIFQRHFNIIRFFIRHTAQIKKPLLYSKARGFSLLYKLIKKHLQIPTGRPLKSIKQKFFHKGRNKRNRRSGKPAEKALLYHFISRNGMRSVLCCSSSTRFNPSNGNPQGTLMQGFGAFPALKKRLPLKPWLSAPNLSRQKQKPDLRR